jgi:hypothetical protein
LETTFNNHGLTKPIADCIDKACIYGVRLPHMLIPASGGNGRSRLTQNIAERIYESNTLLFSSRELFLEVELGRTERSIDEASIIIQENSEYANDYQGVVAFGIDALLPELENKDGAGGKFFGLAKRVGRRATLLLFVPADCPQKKLDRIASEFGPGLRVFDAIVPSPDELAEAFWENLPKKLREKPELCDGFDKHKKKIAAHITETIPKPTFSAVRDAAQNVVHNDAVLKKLFGKFDAADERSV